ncbi:MAG TPA: hypothetical protein VEB21_04800, partial [Terriglobales bacterium]|nr:hypothetical protein [Terriglobales bacterium]
PAHPAPRSAERSYTRAPCAALCRAQLHPRTLAALYRAQLHPRPLRRALPSAATPAHPAPRSAERSYTRAPCAALCRAQLHPRTLAALYRAQLHT